ncbi:MAG: tyrosine-type recombinase/integrase [Candidatus Nanohalobium sp.]
MEYSDQTLQKKLDELENHENISEENYELIEDFYQRIKVDDNIGNERIYKYLTSFKSLFDTSEEYSKKNLIPSDFSLKKATKDDMREVVTRIQSSSYSDWAKSDFKVLLKKFYGTIWGDEFDRPKRVKKILAADFLKKSRNIQNKRSLEALTPSDVKAMAEAAENPRDKLMPIFMFETGARIGEVLGRDAKGYEAEGVKLKDIEMKQKYADVEVETLKNQQKDSKTLQLVRSVGLLQDWLEQHPRKDDPDAHLFVNISKKNKGEVIDQKRFSDVLKELADRAGVEKPIRNHVFRHSSATYKGTELGWNAQRLMYWHGSSDPEWAKGYCHQDEDRMRSARLEEEGIEDADSQKDAALDIRECPRCETSVDPFASFCPQCSLALDHETAQETHTTSEEVLDDVIDEIKDEIGLSDAEIEQKIREKTREHAQNSE